MIDFDEIDEADIYFAKFMLGALGVSALLIAAGIYEVYIAVNNTKKVELSISEFLEKKPANAWVRVTGGTLDVTRAFAEYYIGEDGERQSISRVYIPLTAPDAGENAPYKILVSTREFVYEKMVLERQQLSEEAFKRRVKMAPSLWYRTRAVSGMIDYDVADKTRDLEKLSAKSLPKDLAILRSGSEPFFVGAIVMIAAGLFVPSVLFFIFNRKRRERKRIEQRRRERKERKAKEMNDASDSFAPLRRKRRNRGTS